MFSASPPASEILPGLWLGNERASQDTQWQKLNQIQAIFNCTKDIPFTQGGAPHKQRIPLDDNRAPEEIRNLETWAWESAQKIAKERAAGNRVLVHCFAGVQRSAAVVAIYLVANYRCTTDEAIAFIKSRRSIAFQIQPNFQGSIKGFEDSLRRMIAEKNEWSTQPRIPLPTDTVTNT